MFRTNTSAKKYFHNWKTKFNQYSILEGTSENPVLPGYCPISFDLTTNEPCLIEAGLVDVWRKRAASQVGQEESAGVGNQAGRHLQDGQQPLAGVSDAIWCLQVKNTGVRTRCPNTTRYC